MTTKLGRVTSVFIDPDDNEVKVSVLTGPQQEARVIPFKTPAKGLWAVPDEGDIVEVYNVNREPVARYPHNAPEYSIPADLSQGDFCLKLNENTELRFSTQEDGTVSAALTADSDISISTTGTAIVDADTVKLGGTTGTKVVARKGDTVETNDPLSGSNTGTITSGASNTEAK